MAQDPRNPKTPKIKTDFRKPTKFQADMTKRLAKLSKNKKAKNKVNKPKVPKPSTSSITKILNKMGKRGKAAAAILAGVGIGAGGSALINKKNSVAKSSKAREKSLKEPARKDEPKTRRGPSGPSMTSMRASSTGPKPRNKNVTKRPKRPSKQGSFGR